MLMLNFGKYINLVCLRCSDGVDRHRQEWLDYACSDEVSPDIHHEHVAYLSFLMLRQWVCMFAQGKGATCEEYWRTESFTSSSVTPGSDNVTPPQKSCDSDGEAKLVFYCDI